MAEITPALRDNFNYNFPQQKVDTTINLGGFPFANDKSVITGNITYSDFAEAPAIDGYNFARIVGGEFVTLNVAPYSDVGNNTGGTFDNDLIYFFATWSVGTKVGTIDVTDDSVIFIDFDSLDYFNAIELAFAVTGTKTVSEQIINFDGTLWISGLAEIAEGEISVIMEYTNPNNIFQTGLDFTPPLLGTLQDAIGGRFYGASNLAFADSRIILTDYTLTVPNDPTDVNINEIIFGNDLDGRFWRMISKDSGGWFFIANITDYDSVAIYITFDGALYDRYNLAKYSVVDYFSAASPPFIVGSGNAPVTANNPQPISLPCFNGIMHCVPLFRRK